MPIFLFDFLCLYLKLQGTAIIFQIY